MANAQVHNLYELENLVIERFGLVVVDYVEVRKTTPGVSCGSVARYRFSQVLRARRIVGKCIEGLGAVGCRQHMHDLIVAIVAQIDFVVLVTFQNASI